MLAFLADHRQTNHGYRETRPKCGGSSYSNPAVPDSHSAPDPAWPVATGRANKHNGDEQKLRVSQSCLSLPPASLMTCSLVPTASCCATALLGSTVQFDPCGLLAGGTPLVNNKPRS